METASDVIAGPRHTKAAESETPTGDEYKSLQGLTVSSLQLLPPPTVSRDATTQDALRVARTHNGEQVLVCNDKKLTGFVDMVDLAVNEDMNKPISEIVQPFAGTRESPRTPDTFRVITPDTPLSELAAFLKENPFAIVTDAEREAVLGVAVQGDIDRLSARLGLGESPASLGRRADDESNRDRSLVDFMATLDGYAPLVRRILTDSRRSI